METETLISVWENMSEPYFESAGAYARMLPNARLFTWSDESVYPIVRDFLVGTSADPAGPLPDTPIRIILFTDLESSTALTQALGDAKAQEVLHGHNDVVRAALEAHAGPVARFSIVASSGVLPVYRLTRKPTTSGILLGAIRCGPLPPSALLGRASQRSPLRIAPWRRGEVGRRWLGPALVKRPALAEIVISWSATCTDQLLRHSALIEAFSTSAAFADDAFPLLHQLEEMSGPLPGSVCSLADRAIDAWGAAAGDIQTSASDQASILAKLIVRFYAQASDDAQRKQALDAIDRMLDLGFDGLPDALKAADRV